MPETKESSVGSVVDPYRNFNFKLQIDKVPENEGHFTECSGLAVRVPPIRYREGGGQVRAIPGAVEYAEVTLRYGLTKGTELWKWFLSSVQGKVERRAVSIIVLEPDNNQEAFRWNLSNAWPTEWRGTALDAIGNDAAIEELKLAFEGIERA